MSTLKRHTPSLGNFYLKVLGYLIYYKEFSLGDEI